MFFLNYLMGREPSNHTDDSSNQSLEVDNRGAEEVAAESAAAEPQQTLQLITGKVVQAIVNEQAAIWALVEDEHGTCSIVQQGLNGVHTVNIDGLTRFDRVSLHRIYGLAGNLIMREGVIVDDGRSLFMHRNGFGVNAFYPYFSCAYWRARGGNNTRSCGWYDINTSCCFD